MGAIEDPEKLLLLEIDENLIRKELSPAEQAEQIALKVHLFSKGDLKEISNCSDTMLTQEPLSRLTAETRSRQDAVKNVANQLGMPGAQVSAALKADSAVKKAQLSPNKLKKLSSLEFREVSKTATNFGKSDAEKHLENIVIAKEIGNNYTALALSPKKNAYARQRLTEIKSRGGKLVELVSDVWPDDQYAVEQSLNIKNEIDTLIEYLRKK
jgi:predicted Rossmann fold nucleotide-binding protein DprA/Smf involved in DNA uptake